MSETRKVKHEYPCTECGGDAYVGYSACKKSDWDGKVRIGERICTTCFRKRTGFDMLSKANRRTA